MPKRKEYSVEMREAVIRALNEERTQSSVSRDFGISRQLVVFGIVAIKTEVKYTTRVGRDVNEKQLFGKIN